MPTLGGKFRKKRYRQKLLMHLFIIGLRYQQQSIITKVPQRLWLLMPDFEISWDLVPFSLYFDNRETDAIALTRSHERWYHSVCVNSWITSSIAPNRSDYRFTRRKTAISRNLTEGIVTTLSSRSLAGDSEDVSRGSVRHGTDDLNSLKNNKAIDSWFADPQGCYLEIIKHTCDSRADRGRSST